jgi:hypothetical protein
VSDYNPFIEEGTDSPLEGSPDDVGVAAGDGQPTEEQPTYEEPPRSYLDPSEHADAYVRVKVDGQDVEVPLNEALQGYSRTADYTRKTQELATQRQQAEYALTLQRALQARPAETLRLLAAEYGLDQQPSQSPPPENMWEQPSYDDGDDDLYSDPVEQRLSQQQRMIEELSQREAYREADARLRMEIGGIQQRYNLDEATTREIVFTALQNRMGPESFEMIYKNIAFDRAQAARAQMQAQRSQSDLQREAAKANGSQLVGQGGSANGAGGPQPGVSAGPLSIQEAFELAEREHGTRL